MASITTTGVSPSIETQWQTGWSVRDWVEAHCNSLDTATIDGDTLKTCWPYSGSPPDKCVETDRDTGESDALFLERHKVAYELEMIACPPVN